MDIPVLSPIFGWLFRNIYNLCSNNYLITLFLFAVVIKVLLLPFGIKQQKNTIKQARMRPKEMAIRKKYAGRNDKVTQQKLNEEIMQLYQEENINPMAGCLPLLIQMPVLFALYGVIIKPLTYILGMGKEVIDLILKAYSTVTETAVNNYAQIQAISKIVSDNEMSAKIGDEFAKLASEASVSADWSQIQLELSELFNSFNVFGIDMTKTPQIAMNIYILIPILTFVFAFVSTKITRKFTYQPTGTNPDQARSLAMMDWMMPLMSVWISFNVSSAIAVYWMFQNVLSALQQIILYKLYPIPPCTEEDIRAAELALKGKPNKKKAVPATYEIDDYDKTTQEEKDARLHKQNKARKDGISNAKGKLSPKIVKKIKESGKPLKAKRKI